MNQQHYYKKIGALADKRFGQNFLKDEAVLDKIIQSMSEKNKKRIVEIGPGLGDLTSRLMRVANVTAYEVDKRLCSVLRESFYREIEEKTLLLICGDVLDHWNRRGLLREPYDLVANLPYYIATKLLLNALRDPYCDSILVMVQKELAEKFVAKSGEKRFSALAVLCQTVGESSICFEVPPSSFVPPPKVDSAVLSIKKHDHLSEEGFEEFLKKAFCQPRKKLLKNLSGSFSAERIREIFYHLGLMENLRPHEVETTVYHQLYHALTKERKNGFKTKELREQKQNEQRKEHRRETETKSKSVQERRDPPER